MIKMSCFDDNWDWVYGLFKLESMIVFLDPLDINTYHFSSKFFHWIEIFAHHFEAMQL